MTIDQWAGSVDGRTVGPGDSNGECVGLAYDYVVNCLGSNFVSTNYGPHSGYAIGSWDSGLTPAGMARIPGAADIQKGDVVFWNWGMPFTMSSHVAVAMGSPVGGMLPVESQHSPMRAATRQMLPTVGIAGVWRAGGGGGTGGTELASDTSGAPGVSAVPAAVTAALAGLGNAGLWKRVGIFALGAVLLMIVLGMLFGKTDIAGAIEKGM